MRFYGRSREMKVLSEPGSPFFIVLWGRRRIGKTSLALKAFEDPLYFFVGRKSSSLLLEEFTEVVRKDHNYIPTFKDWEEFFVYLTNEYSGTVIIDEFQNFQFSDPSVFSTLQKIVDRASSYRLVVVGSYVGMMKKIFMDSREPLFGRATGNMRVGPLPFPVVWRILEELGIRDIREKISIYSVFGGVPYHYALMEKHRATSYIKCIEKLVFSPLAPLRSEVKNVLIEEFGRNYTTYFSILQAVAGGSTTLSGISNSTGILIQSLGKYLQELMEVYDILERIVPIDESRRGVYHIKDPFTRFWFRYVESHLSDMELGRYEYPLKIALEGQPMISSWEFENLIRDLLHPSFNKVGKWWNRKGEEIDVVAVNDNDGIVLFAEVKWTNRKAGKKELSSLISRSEMVSMKKDYRREYLMVSRSGFKDLEAEDGITLWDLEDVNSRVKEIIEGHGSP
ncbi:MAG: ATP-binding protein [Thermoplasmatota archaeon]